MVSVKVSVSPADAAVASTGPATTVPFSSTIDTLLKSGLPPVVVRDEVEIVAVKPVIDTASPEKFVVKPPIGWLLTLIATFCAAALPEFALLIVVTVPPLMVAW